MIILSPLFISFIFLPYGTIRTLSTLHALFLHSEMFYVVFWGNCFFLLFSRKFWSMYSITWFRVCVCVSKWIRIEQYSHERKLFWRFIVQRNCLRCFRSVTTKIWQFSVIFSIATRYAHWPFYANCFRLTCESNFFFIQQQQKIKMKCRLKSALVFSNFR